MAATIVKADGSTFVFDAVTRIAYTPTVSTTDHSIETGSTITDHAQRQPLLVSITAVVSESPFSNVASSGGISRVREAVAFLKSCEGELVDVVDERLGTATNCLLTRYPHEVTQLRRLEFAIELKQVTLAEAAYVTIPVGVTTEEGAVGFPDRVDNGSQPTASTSTGSTAGGATEGEAQEEQDKSWLLQGLEAIGAL